MMQDITTVHEDPDNLRRTPPSPAAEAAMLASIRQCGIVIPLLVRHRAGGGFIVDDGNRRLRAARAAGLTEVPVVYSERGNALGHTEAQAVANIVRAKMHEVDEWRALLALRGAGLSESGAANALGLESRQAKRMALLAQILPEILEAMAACDVDDMPRAWDIAKIAAAPLDAQRAAWEKHRPQQGEAPSWWKIAQPLDRVRIPRRHAQFDDALAEKHGVAWTEDLFAEADDPDAVHTTNPAGFRAAQQEWLETVHIPGLLAQRYQAEALTPGKDGFAKPPKGMISVHVKDPEKAPKRVIRGYWVDQCGLLRCETYERPPAPVKAPKGKPKLEEASAPEAAPAPKPQRGKPATPAPVDEPEDEDDAPDEPAASPLPREAPVLTKAGVRAVADAKTASLVRDLATIDERTFDGIWLCTSALLLAIAGGNVRITHGVGVKSRAILVQDLADKVEGCWTGAYPDKPRLLQLVLEALGRIVAADPPDASDYRGGSGPRVFDAIARLLELPPTRCDTADILSETRLTTLRELATAAGVKSNQAALILQRELIGKAPHWHPAGADYAAPAKAEAPAEETPAHV